MKKILFLLLGLSIAMFACKDDDDPNNSKGNGNDTTENSTQVKKELKESNVLGVVLDSKGNPLSGVDVESGSLTVVTNSDGRFVMSQVSVAGGRTLLTFKKDGFFKVTRSEELKENTIMEVVLQEKGNGSFTVQKDFQTNDGVELKVSGMEVAIDANSLVKKDGSSYSGTVHADMLYLDPNNKDFSTMMPGSDMAAIRTDNSSSTLVSYGMVEVSLTGDKGEALQLKKGEKSTLTFPIPEGMTANPPATIPLWSFDDNSGLWVEEGIATLQGDVYVGEVAHFSWHNLDYPEERVTLKGKLTDCNGDPVSGVKVTVEQVSAFTDYGGNYLVYVPSNTPVTVTVLKEDYFNYDSDVVEEHVPGCSGGTVYTQNISMPCTPVVKGKALNTCGNRSFVCVYVKYTLDGKRQTTAPVISDINGEYSVHIPMGISSATLYIETFSGDKKEIELTGLDQEIIVVEDVDFCQESGEKDGEQIIYIKKEDGTIETISFKNDKLFVSIADGSLIIANGDQVNSSMQNEDATSLIVNNYNNKDSYFSSTLSFIKDGTMLMADTLSCSVTRESGKIILQFTGNGYWISFSNVSGMSTVSVSGIIEVPNIHFDENVTDANAIDYMPSDVLSVLPMPISYTCESYYFKMLHGQAIYTEGSKEMFETIVAGLEKVGYKQYDEYERVEENEMVFVQGSNIVFVSLDENDELTVQVSPKEVLNYLK